MLSEGELHVQAMRLVCEALADREKTGLEVDWDVINQQLDHMDVILQGITDQRNDDAEEIQILKKQRDAAYEKLSTLRDEVAAEIESLRKDRDHWKTARQEAIEAGELMKAEIETLRQQLTAAEAAVSLQRAGIERLNAFVGRARELLRIPLAKITYDEMAIVRAELAALDAETSEAEGGQ